MHAQLFCLRLIIKIIILIMHTYIHTYMYIDLQRAELVENGIRLAHK